MLEQIISAISPKYALSRARYRAALDQVRGYDSAKMGRRGDGWTTQNGSSSSELQGGSLHRVRSRARDAVQNNEFAVAAVRALCASAIGTGIQVFPKLKSEREQWVKWANSTDCDADGQLDFAGLQLLAAKTVFVSGEVLIQKVYDSSKEIPLRLRILEPDHLDVSKTGMIGENQVIMGVEFDRFGGRAAYWLFKTHPGEVGGVYKSMVSVRVPASDVLHVFVKDRPSQVRGVSILSPGLSRLRELSDLDDANLLRKKIEACFGAFVTTDGDSAAVGQVSGKQGASFVEKLAPGVIKYLKPGEKVDFANPSASNSDGFRRDNVKSFAVGVGVTYEQVSGDLSNTTYSSARVGLVEHRLFIDQLQWLCLVPMMIKPIRKWWRDAAQLAGVKVGVKPDDIATPKRPWVDPLKDVMAAKEEVKAGWKSGAEVIREMGYYPDQVIDDINQWASALKDAGVVTDTDPAVSELGLNPLDVMKSEEK